MFSSSSSKLFANVPKQDFVSHKRLEKELCDPGSGKDICILD